MKKWTQEMGWLAVSVACAVVIGFVVAGRLVFWLFGKGFWWRGG